MKAGFSKYEAVAIALFLGLTGPSWLSAASSTTTNAFPTEPLSLADAVNLALQQNPSVLRAQKDVEEVQGVVIQTRAAVLPALNVAGK
jgi:outer membrane protein TolC